MSLVPYQKKRHFKQTPEPQGKSRKKHQPIFVIQKHAASHLHYDLRLAIHGTLKSWAVPKGPCLDPSVKRLAIEVEDHPLSYANFEGTIPKGQYGAGTVLVWDYGTFETNENFATAHRRGSMTFILHGEKLRGEWHLVRLANTEKKPQWLLIKAKDEFSRKLKQYDVTLAEPGSVLSPRKLRKSSKATKPRPKITATKKANKIQVLFNPELATLSESLPKGDQWLYEEKYDGYRMIAYVDKENVLLISRNGLNWTDNFLKIKSELQKLNLDNTLLDGEIVAFSNGKKTSFQLLQNYLQMASHQNELHYFVFDMPVLKNKNLMDLPLSERKKLLFNKVFNKTLKHVHYAKPQRGKAEAILKKACDHGLEGIIAKDKHSPYQQRRTTDWLKLRCQKRQEFVIVGYTDPKGAREYFGSLLLGYYDKKNDLIYAGHVGTGFNQKTLKELSEKLFQLETSKLPFRQKPSDSLGRYAHWVKPKLIVEVSFTEWTDEGLLRHPVYEGLRADKSPRQINRELPETTAIRLTHPNKILYAKSKNTKTDLAEYLVKISDKILSYIARRPIALLRCPHGGNQKCFFQKHWTTGMPEGLELIKIPGKENSNYITVTNQEGLIGLAQLDVLEIHPWSSRNDKLDYPDQIIFDLDPSETLPWDKLIAAAKIVHRTLNNLELVNFVKLTGGKGLHVVVPIRRTKSFKEIKAFTKLLAEKLTGYYPDIFTANIRKKMRTGKVFIDYLRNDKEATAIAPFSPRRDPHATIAVPISWQKLSRYKNARAYTINTIDQYFKDYPQDPWKQFFKIKQSITNAHVVALENM